MSRSHKEQLVSAICTMSINDSENQIRAGRGTAEIHVIGLNAGVPAVPSAGTFTITAQLVTDGAFYALADGGVLDATLCGGSATTDGTGEYASMRGFPVQIKVVPAGVTGVTHYRVSIVQEGSY